MPWRAAGLSESPGGDSTFAPGVPRGAVPTWGCQCGRDRIWGTRRACPGCGRLAPDRIQRLQKEAAARAGSGGGARTAGTIGQRREANSGAGQGSEEQRRLLEKMRQENVELRQKLQQREAGQPDAAIVKDEATSPDHPMRECPAARADVTALEPRNKASRACPKTRGARTNCLSSALCSWTHVKPSTHCEQASATHEGCPQIGRR